MEGITSTPRKRKRCESTVSDRAKEYFEEIKQDKVNSVNLTPSKKTHTCKLCKFNFNGTKSWNLAAHLSARHPDIYFEISEGIIFCLL